MPACPSSSGAATEAWTHSASSGVSRGQAAAAARRGTGLRLEAIGELGHLDLVEIEPGLLAKGIRDQRLEEITVDEFVPAGVGRPALQRDPETGQGFRRPTRGQGIVHVVEQEVLIDVRGVFGLERINIDFRPLGARNARIGRLDRVG